MWSNIVVKKRSITKMLATSFTAISDLHLIQQVAVVFTVLWSWRNPKTRSPELSLLTSEFWPWSRHLSTPCLPFCFLECTDKCVSRYWSQFSFIPFLVIIASHLNCKCLAFKLIPIHDLFWRIKELFHIFPIKTRHYAETGSFRSS